MANRRKFLTAIGLGICGPTMTSPFSVQEKKTPKLEFAFKAEITVNTIMELGITQHGIRRIIPITGGNFEGPAIKGQVVEGGADWQIIRNDNVAELEARYTLRTDDDALIYVINKGFRHGPDAVMQRLAKGEPVDPREYYFRTTPIFETSVEKYHWLTKHIFIGTGERLPGRVFIDFYKLL